MPKLFPAPSPRLTAIVALTFAALGCAAQRDEAQTAVPTATADAVTEVSRAEQPGREQPPVAPMPHRPGKGSERNRTNEDVPLDTTVEADQPALDRLNTETADDFGLDPKIEPLDNMTVTGVPGDATGATGAPVLQPAKGKEKVEPKPGAASPFSGRTGETKEKLLKAAGGTADTEKAVTRGLAWLAKQQQADGGWKFDNGKTDERAAATGMVVLAYLGAGHTHKAPKEKPKDDKSYAPVVGKGIGFLSKLCALNGANAGRLSADAYANAIAALALVEAYGMTGDAALKPFAQAAVNYIQKSQAKNGSWGYTPQTNGDTSITGWQLQVLFAAKNSKGLVADDKVIKAAVGFVDTTAAGPKKAAYGYQDSAGAAPGTSLTAIGLLCRYRHDGWNQKSPGLVQGVEGLLKVAPEQNRPLNTYHLYYASLVLRGFDGEEWRTWNEGKKGADNTRTGGMRDVLPAAQVVKDGADYGSWGQDASLIGPSCGRLGTTALCVLSLEAYYRYVPLYERPADDK